MQQQTDAEELARARLAYVSAGQRSLSAPRHALWEPEDEVAEAVVPAALAPAPAAPGAPTKRRPFTLRHLAVVVALLLCGVGVAVAALAKSSATEVPVEPVAVASVEAAPASPEPVPLVRVHVVGAVANPGVVSLPEGSIVEDAILAAGGLTPAADPALLNFAAPVSDGMQVAIGTKDDPLGEVSGDGATGSGGGDAGKVLNLNTATQAELEALPGVGPVMAGAIIAWREEHGKFTAVEELQEISGIGPKTFQKLQPMVRV